MKNMSRYKRHVSKVIFFLFIFFVVPFQLFCEAPLAEHFKQVGYLEICDREHGAAAFETLYAYFDDFIEFLQRNPTWAQKLYNAKERFIRSKNRNFYSTDFF